MRIFVVLTLLLTILSLVCQFGLNDNGQILVRNVSVASPSPTIQSSGWTRIEPGGETRCAHDTPFAYWVRPGMVNKLLVFFQGGGACFDANTCAPGSGQYDES